MKRENPLHGVKPSQGFAIHHVILVAGLPEPRAPKCQNPRFKAMICRNLARGPGRAPDPGSLGTSPASGKILSFQRQTKKNEIFERKSEKAVDRIPSAA
jgi:hypothetical protein